MKDCDKEIRDYQSNRVALSSAQRKGLRERRDANRARVRRGLERNDDPKPKKFVGQGSFTMRTTIQEPNNDYDIDDGAVFSRESLQGTQGADKSALDARKMARDAVDDGSFKRAPEIKPNCVRVFYDDGPHVDIPVYRSVTQDDGEVVYELASADWKQSDPEGVNAWFAGSLERRAADGQTQLRELIRLLKSLCANRTSYSLPSGFVLTVLVEELFTGPCQRLDIGLREVMKAVHDRLKYDLAVKHPVVDEWLCVADDSKTKKLREVLEKALDALAVLDRPSCTQSMALKAWKKVLATDYFDAAIADSESNEKARASAAAASIGVAPKPYGHSG